MFTKKTIARVLVYLSGLCILALGLTLSTKADLGVSPIIAVSFCVSKLTGARFGDMTFLLYASFVAIEMLLQADTMTSRIAVMLISVILVGTGAALSLDMRLVANPGDGLVQAISDRTGIELGLSKNIVDITCVAFTCILSMAAAHRILGVGFGTVIAMLGIGRVIALINRSFGKKLALLSRSYG